MMVEIAAIVGSMKSRNALNICLVMVVFTPPEIKMEMITSSKEVRKDRSAAVNYDNLKNIFKTYFEDYNRNIYSHRDS